MNGLRENYSRWRRGARGNEVLVNLDRTCSVDRVSNWLGGRESLPRLFENLRNTPNLAERVSVQQFAALNRLRRLSSVRRFRISPAQ